MKILYGDLSREATRYLTVGSIGYVIDVGLFNLLSFLSIEGLSEVSQVGNKAMSTSVAIVVTYMLNGHWTFRHRTGRPEGIGRMGRYLLVSIVGMGIQVGTLFVSHNVLGFTSLLADNIAANVIGVGLALVFRFLANRNWVFTDANS